MARAVAARTQGDAYQARFFWLQVCRLFQAHTQVTHVGYDVDGIKAFDDVVVAYDPPVHDDLGGVVATDYFQIKYHVSQAGTIRFESLMDPEFIGAARFSLLQRLRDAHLETVGRGGCRFILVTPWPIDPRDPLSELINNNAGQLHLNKLFSGGPKSRMGLLRRKAADHLEVDEQALRDTLASLRIHHSEDLARLNDRLSDKLALAGMAPRSLEALSSPYDDLALKLLQTERNCLTATEVKEICEREGLWVGRAHPPDSTADLGIRSFGRRAEYMEDEAESVLDLVPYFEGRAIRDATLWNTSIATEVVHFLEASAKAGEACRLQLDAHASVAALAGYCLDSKAGVQTTLVQKTRNGVEVWEVAEPADGAAPSWDFGTVPGDPVASDLAVAVSVAHDVRSDVEVFLRQSGLSVRQTLTATMEECGGTAIQGGGHALALAQALVAELRTHRRSGQTAHLFIAAPNAFSFVLGQHLRAVGPTVIYEFNFESGEPGAYQAGIALPPASVATAQIS